MIRMFILLLAVIMMAEAKCFCTKHDTSNTNRRYFNININKGCIDTESIDKCNAVEDKIRDWTSEIMEYARLMTLAHPNNNTLVDAKNLATLSVALEDRTPADCHSESFTIIPWENTTWAKLYPFRRYMFRGHCIAKKVLAECERVMEFSTIFPRKVMTFLENRSNFEEVTPNFINLMAIRILKINNFNLSCDVSDYNQNDIDVSSSISEVSAVANRMKGNYLLLFSAFLFLFIF